MKLKNTYVQPLLEKARKKTSKSKVGSHSQRDKATAKSYLLFTVIVIFVALFGNITMAFGG